jgi:hypothetical protein
MRIPTDLFSRRIFSFIFWERSHPGIGQFFKIISSWFLLIFQVILAGVELAGLSPEQDRLVGGGPGTACCVSTRSEQ